jgi:hypothetical protein
MDTENMSVTIPMIRIQSQTGVTTDVIMGFQYVALEAINATYKQSH